MVRELFFERDWLRDGDKFHHRQLFFNGSVYIYEVSNCANGSNHWYEIFKRKVIPDVINVDGKLKKSNNDFHVKYPSNESFGKWAFCCHDFECIKRALHECHEINKPIRQMFMQDVEDINKWLSEAQKCEGFL